MHTGKLVFAQLMEHLPLTTFRRCVARYGGHHKVQHFSCLDQYLSMAFAQLTFRESLRDIEACLRAQPSKLYHLGIRGQVSRNTLAHANAIRDWRIYCDFAQSLIAWPAVSTPTKPLASISETRLRAGCHHHRSVSFGIPVGTVPFDQGSYQVAHAARPAWQHPIFHSYQRWQGSRGQHPRSTDLRAGRVLCHGSRLHRFRAPVPAAASGQLLCHPRQVNLKFQRRYSHKVDKATGVICDQTVMLTVFYSRQGFIPTTQKNHIRSRDCENSRLSHQQLHAAGSDHCSTLPLPLAGRVVLQVDQATSAHQSFLRHYRERRADSNLDRDLGLRARRHRQKTAQPIGQSLRTPTDLQRHDLRESFNYSTTYSMPTSEPINDSSKPIEFVQITLGHF